MSGKLDMSLEDLIKRDKNKHKPGLKPKLKPTQEQQQKGKGINKQSTKPGVKGKAVVQQVKKGITLKAKGGVTKAGAGAASRAGAGKAKQQQRPGQLARQSRPDVRVVPRPNPAGFRRPLAPRPRLAPAMPHIHPMGMHPMMHLPLPSPMHTPAPMPAPVPQQGKWQNDLFDGSVVSSSTSAKL
eukprot:GHRR01015077.1.p1 GENE.GHRR01015077.1~~GHRR01015077.1.p1  ORF type:complete len:184 (+),score=43.61 GHRR01015077.1:189-740(+)